MIILNFPGSDVENIIDPNSEGAICSKDGSVYGDEKRLNCVECDFP